MLDRNVSLPGVESYPAAPTPTVSKAWVELQGTVHQPDRRFAVLPEVTHHVASMHKYARVVARNVKGLASEVDGLTPVRIPTVCPAGYVKLNAAPRRQSRLSRPLGVIRVRCGTRGASPVYSR